MEQYFPTEALEKQIANDWIREPSKARRPKGLSGFHLNELIDLQCDSGLQSKFNETSLAEFWAGTAQDFPLLSEIALRTLIPFVGTYLAESGFSIYSSTKTKSRNRLDAENDMRIQLSSKAPDFESIAAELQAQPSH